MTNDNQSIFLNNCRRQKMPVTVFLVNGFQLRGIVLSFDAYAVVIDSDGKQQFIYKHAISTIQPVRPVSLRAEDKEAVADETEG